MLNERAKFSLQKQSMALMRKVRVLYHIFNFQNLFFVHNLCQLQKYSSEGAGAPNYGAVHREKMKKSIRGTNDEYY